MGVRLRECGLLAEGTSSMRGLRLGSSQVELAGSCTLQWIPLLAATCRARPAPSEKPTAEPMAVTERPPRLNMLRFLG